MKELKLAWRYVRRHWWQYILGILALFIVDAVNTYVPRFTGEITNGLDQHTLDMGGVMGLVWKIVLIGVIIAVGRFAWRFFLFGSARSIEKELRSDLFAHLSSLSPHYYNEHKTGDLMARFINDLQAVRTLVGMNVISAFDATVMLLLVLWQMMTYVSPKLTGGGAAADSHHLRRLLLRQGDAQALSGQAAGVFDADGPQVGNGVGHPRD